MEVKLLLKISGRPCKIMSGLWDVQDSLTYSSDKKCSMGNASIKKLYFILNIYALQTC